MAKRGILWKIVRCSFTYQSRSDSRLSLNRFRELQDRHLGLPIKSVFSYLQFSVNTFFDISLHFAYPQPLNLRCKAFISLLDTPTPFYNDTVPQRPFPPPLPAHNAPASVAISTCPPVASPPPMPPPVQATPQHRHEANDQTQKRRSPQRLPLV